LPTAGAALRFLFCLRIVTVGTQGKAAGTPPAERAGPSPTREEDQVAAGPRQPGLLGVSGLAAAAVWPIVIPIAVSHCHDHSRVAQRRLSFSRGKSNYRYRSARSEQGQ